MLQWLEKFYPGHGEQIISAGGKTLAIIIGYLLLRFVLFKVFGRVIDSVIDRVGSAADARRAARLRTLQTLTRSVVGFVLGFVAGIMVLDAVGINITAIITTAGIAGVAVGFGAQKLVRDIVSGFFILVEDQFGVGDYVTVGAATGVVEEMGMRVTKIRAADGRLIILSNGDISQVTNHSRGTIRLSIDLAVAEPADMDALVSLLDSAGKLFSGDDPNIVGDFRFDGVSAFSGASVIVRTSGSVVGGSEEAVRMSMLEKLRTALADDGIKLA